MDYQGINQEELNQMAQLKQIEEMKKQIMSRLLSKEAYERLGRVRSVNPQLASQVELYLLQVYQSGQLKGTVTESQLKEMLKAVSGAGKREFNIKRK